MIDAAKLQRLRDRYANASGGDIFDPEFARVAALQFTDGDKRSLPYAGRQLCWTRPIAPTRRISSISAASTSR